MVNTSTRPITVDGVRLDTLAWNIEKVERATAGRRSGDYSSPLMDGTVAGLNDALEPSVFGLQMWLQGTDVDGAVPAAGRTTTLRENLDELLHLFGKRHQLLDLREQTGNGTWARNLVTNRDAPAALGAGATITHNVSYGGQTWKRVAVTTASHGVRHLVDASELVNGSPYTASFLLANDSGVSVTVSADWCDATGATWTLAAGETRLVSFTGTRATYDSTFRFLDISLPTVGTSILFRQVAIVPGSVAVDTYFDGDTAWDADYLYRWEGAAGASVSRREARNTRRCWAKVVEAIAPDINTAGSAGVFSVALTIPAGMWEDPDQQDWTQVAPVTAAEVTTMQGSTERINDAVYLVKGPANTPRITDPATGMFVELGQNLPAGSFWRFSSGSWASRVGTTLTLGSMDTDGTDVAGVTGVGGPARAYGLPLVPVRDAGARRVDVTLTAASGIVNGTTALSVRARRKYAA